MDVFISWKRKGCSGGQPVQAGLAPGAPEQDGGEHGVAEKDGQRGPGDRGGDGGQPGGDQRVEPADQNHGQKAPGQREGQAYPPLQAAGQAAIVPEGDVQNVVVKQGRQVFRRSGSQPAQQKQSGQRTGNPAGQQQNGAGAKAVDRTQGEQQQTLAVGIAPGGPGIGHLKEEAHQAVKEKGPKPDHRTNLHFLARSGSEASKRLPEALRQGGASAPCSAAPGTGQTLSGRLEMETSAFRLTGWQKTEVSLSHW